MTDAPPVIRVATWNIRAAIGPGEPFPAAWWRHVSRDRFERIAAVIRELDADIVGLQEVAIMTPGWPAVRPAARARPAHRPIGPLCGAHTFDLVEPEDGRSIGISTWGNVLLTRVPLDDGFALRLPAGGDTDHVEPLDSDRPLAGVTFLDAPYGTREPRCVVGGRLALSGSAVRIVNTHLTYAGTEQRRVQAETLARLALDGEGPVVVMGDLNAAIDAPALPRCPTTLDDAFGAVGVGVADPRRASSGLAAIDHVLSRGLRAVECRVVTEAGDASDHLPVVATLEVVATPD